MLFKFQTFITCKTVFILSLSQLWAHRFSVGLCLKKPQKKQKWQVCVWFKRTTNVVRLWENNICTFQTICFACVNACYRETERNGGKSLFLFCSEVYLISLEGFTGQNLGSERFAIWSLYVVTAVSLYGHNFPPPLFFMFPARQEWYTAVTSVLLVKWAVLILADKAVRKWNRCPWSSFGQSAAYVTVDCIYIFYHQQPFVSLKITAVQKINRGFSQLMI